MHVCDVGKKFERKRQQRIESKLSMKDETIYQVDGF